MKKLFILINFVAAIFTSPAFAYLPVEETPESYSARILNHEIRHDFLQNSTNGMVRLNLTDEEIVLVLQQKWTCPEGLACATVMPEPITLKLPLINVFTDWCGATTYVAEVDNTPVDGLLQQIKVTDYTTLECRIAMPYMTTIEYNTLNPWTNEWKISNFNAEALSMDAVLFNEPVLLETAHL